MAAFLLIILSKCAKINQKISRGRKGMKNKEITVLDQAIHINKDEVITPRLLLLLDSFLRKVFDNYGERTACEVIQKFNDEIDKEEYKSLKSLSDSDNFKIQIFDEQERAELIEAVSKLKWETAYKLFNEVFTEKSKYMTVHQAKGL